MRFNGISTASRLIHSAWSRCRRRLESIYDIARKHRVVPERLAALHQALRDELQGLADGGQRIAQLEQEMAELARQYASDAARLGKQRRSAAKKLVQTRVCSSGVAGDGRLSVRDCPHAPEK